MQVDDAVTRSIVPVPFQRLVRWSVIRPESAFLNGFPPKIIPELNTFPPEAFNLRAYVGNNRPSIFVGTTRPRRHPTNGTLSLWQRRAKDPEVHLFEYHIYAYGGIDVNLVLGQHQHARQHEVVFPGGIRPEMIRCARERKESRIICNWVNTHFNFLANPHVPPDSEDPGVPRTPANAHCRDYPE